MKQASISFELLPCISKLKMINEMENSTQKMSKLLKYQTVYGKILVMCLIFKACELRFAVSTTHVVFW